MYYNLFVQLTCSYQSQRSGNSWCLKCIFHLLWTSYVDLLDPKGTSSDTTSSKEQITQLVGLESRGVKEALNVITYKLTSELTSPWRVHASWMSHPSAACIHVFSTEMSGGANGTRGRKKEKIILIKQKCLLELFNYQSDYVLCVWGWAELMKKKLT